MAQEKVFDILVCGGGLAGLTAAFTLAEAGNSVCICASGSNVQDKRTTALLSHSVEFFRRMGIWEHVADKAHPLKIMRLVDGTNRLFRIQQADFRSSDIDLDAFGYNVRNRDVLVLLNEKIAAHPSIEVVTGTIDALEISQDNQITAQVSKPDNSADNVHARFIVGADGRNSVVRAHFGHGERSWSYPQMAIVVDFDHEYASNYTSTEFHTETGPFTIVPHSQNSAGLVWLETFEAAERINVMGKEELNTVLEEKMQSFLGKISVKESVQVFPMTGLIARRFGDRFHALIGEAAHVFPPIGAQGFNLGIRDIESLVNVMSRYTSAENRGDEYHKARSVDVNSRTIGVDLLNRSLLSPFMPVQMIRSAGIYALNNLPSLRKSAMRLGMSPIIHG
ncbi:MAG: FAD-dependent monooxygenase [Pseudomonadota bacterium]